jgi:hypothetical protein
MIAVGVEAEQLDLVFEIEQGIGVPFERAFERV